MSAFTRNRLTPWLIALLVSTMAGAPPAAGEEPAASKQITDDDLARLTVEIEAEVEELRGWKFKHHVKAAVYTEEGLHAFMQRGFAEEGDGWGQRDRSAAAMKMIGLIPQDCDPVAIFEEVTGGFVPAIYDHKTKTLGVVNRGAVDLDSLHVRVMIAHELTHALDDQYFNLEKLMEDDTADSDAGAVIGAVVEGSAVVLQTRYERRALASGKYDASQLWQDRAGEMKGMTALFEAPPYVATFLARFPCGVRFLRKGEMLSPFGTDDPGSVAEAVRKAMTDRPRSSEQILHSHKYWNEQDRDEPVVVNDEEVEKLLAAEGLHVAFRDTIGELLCAVLTSPADKKVNPMAMPLPGYWTTPGATGWGGDRLFLLTAEPQPEDLKEQPQDLRAVWLTMWDTEQDRDEFVEAYKKHRPLLSQAVLEWGKLGAVFFFGFDEAQRTALERRLQSGTLRFAKGEQPWSCDAAP
jgi:hypothetical protein